VTSIAPRQGDRGPAPTRRPALVSVPDPSRGGGLDGLLAARLRRGLGGTVLADRTATVVFDGSHGDLWTVELAGGRGRVRRGGAPAPTLVVQGSTATLADVVSGDVSGIDVFLEGKVTVRGDLALALLLDGLFLGADERPDRHPRARVVDAMGVRTAYLEAGPADGRPVLLLHGLGATNASLLPVLAGLAADHRVLAPDLPGFGASGAPGAPYSSAWFAAWVEAFQGATASRGAVLLGNSLGGRIALEAGLTHPRSVSALVLLTPSPAFRSMRQFVPLVRAMNPALGRVPFPRLPHRLFVEAIRSMMSVPERLPDAWYAAAADEAQRVFRSPAHRAAFLAATRQIYLEEAHGRHGFWDRLPRLEPPALFVWGDRDRLVPSSFARHVSDALPHAASIVLEDCGHVPQFEHPAETLALVRGFLDET
jgi:pimeloyl-ACP methyl ester carboxylesterase